jgi:hypothetical protein
MAVTSYLYNEFPHLLLENGLGGSILTQDIYVALFTNAAAPSQDHQYLSEELAVMTESSGTGYTHLGAALASKTCTVTDHVTTFKAANLAWTGSSITTRYAIIYYNKSGDTSHTASTLIGWVDFGEDKTTVVGTFTITWDVAGIFTFTVTGV